MNTKLFIDSEAYRFLRHFNLVYSKHENPPEYPKDSMELDWDGWHELDLDTSMKLIKLCDDFIQNPVYPSFRMNSSSLLDAYPEGGIVDFAKFDSWETAEIKSEILTARTHFWKLRNTLLSKFSDEERNGLPYSTLEYESTIRIQLAKSTQRKGWTIG